MSHAGADDEPKKPNHERWVISYADFMTLLFALFVVLFASSTRDRVKMEEEAKGMIAAFHGVSPSMAQLEGRNAGVLRDQTSPIAKPVQNPAPRSPRSLARPKEAAPVRLNIPPQAHPVAVAPRQALVLTPHPPHPQQPTLSRPLTRQLAQEIHALDQVKQQLQRLLHPLIAAHEVSIEATPLSLTISLDAAVLFDSGKASLLPAARKLLSNVSDSLKTLPAPFTINLRGYTDNQPIDTVQFPSNWSLSAERAVSVVALFSTNGIDGARLSAQGFGQYAPIADNKTAEGRAKNRRVEVVIRAPDVKTPGE
jgi:chemotaxis protein MotB